MAKLSFLPPFTFYQSNHLSREVANFLFELDLHILPNGIANVYNFSFFEIEIVSFHRISIV